MINKYGGIILMMSAAIFFIASTNKTPVTPTNNAENIVGCSPLNNENIQAGADGKFIRVMPGWGDHAYAISTKSDSAQLYFNQGLSMYYSYHQREAVASFREAARFDSTAAIIYWAQALALRWALF